MNVLLQMLHLLLAQNESVLWDARNPGASLQQSNVNLKRDGGTVTLTATGNVAAIAAIPADRDWSKYSGFSINLKSTLDTGVALTVETERGTMRSQSLLLSGEPVKVYFDAENTALPMPRPVFQGYYRHALAQSTGDLSRVKRWTLTFYRPGALISADSLKGVSPRPTYGAWADKYGQLIERDWPGKVRSDADLKTVEPSSHYPNVDLPIVSKTGNWSVVQDTNGRSYFLTPDKKRFWSFGITAVTTDRPANYQRTMAAVSESDKLRPGSSSNGKLTLSLIETNLERKFGIGWGKLWRDETAKRLVAFGFNTLGNGSEDTVIRQTGLPFIVTLSTTEFSPRISVPGGSLPDPFDRGYSAWVKQRWGDELREFARRPNFIGFYMDGERPWGNDEAGPDGELAVPLAVLRTAGTPAKAKLIEILKSELATPSLTSAALGTPVTDWSSLDRPISLRGQALTPAGRKALQAFLEEYAAAYTKGFDDTLASLRIKPLILGGRDLASTPDSVFRGQARYADTLSVDEYDRTRRMHWSKFARLPKPVLLGEFGYVAQDGNSMSGVNFSPAIVAPNQATRAQWADETLRRAATEPNVIGAHWFLYYDQPVTGRPQDGENYSIGIVNVVDKPYEPLTRVFRKFAEDLYRIR